MPDAVARVLAAPGLRWIATGPDGRVLGYAALSRLPGWSDHVGELRLVVGSANRGGGIGRKLVQQALREGFAAGLTKVMIELATDEDRVLTMFSELGFTGEALLRDHIRDRSGELRDLVVLAHHAHEAARRHRRDRTRRRPDRQRGEPDMTNPVDLFRMHDRVAVVTGASSGLGVGFARALARAGADVVLAARRVDRLEETARLVEAEGRRARSRCSATWPIPTPAPPWSPGPWRSSVGWTR